MLPERQSRYTEPIAPNTLTPRSLHWQVGPKFGKHVCSLQKEAASVRRLVKKKRTLTQLLWGLEAVAVAGYHTDNVLIKGIVSQK